MVPKFLRIMFNDKVNIEDGIDISNTCYPTYNPLFKFLNYAEFDQFSDCDEGEASFSSEGSISREVCFDLNISRVVWSPNICCHV
jgi:hypothetical protein